MLPRTILTSILATMILLLVCNGVASAAQASRIELKDSTVFENVSYRINKTYKVVVIEIGDQEQNVSFTNIARIFDSSGKDVTARCLGRHYLVPGTQAVEETSFKTQTEVPGRKKHPFGVAFRTGMNFSIPSGEWYEGTRSGLGFGGDMLVTVGRKLALRGMISRSGARHNPDEMFGGWQILKDDLSWNVWRYFISLQYYNWPRWREDGRTMYYVFSGIGGVSHSLSGTAVVGDPVGDIWLFSGTGQSETKFATTVGGGLVAMVSRTVGLELGAVVDIVFVGRTNNPDYDYGPYASDVVTAGLIDLRLGVVFLIP